MRGHNSGGLTADVLAFCFSCFRPREKEKERKKKKEREKRKERQRRSKKLEKFENSPASDASSQVSLGPRLPDASIYIYI
jgi:hypothetical protein